MTSRLVRNLVPGASLVAIALGAGLIWLRLADDPLAGPPRETWIGETRLAVPPAYARLPIGRAGGVQEQLALAATFPGFEAPRDGAPPLVFLTLAASDRTVDPADRPATLYARFLEEERVERPDGLLMRRFQAGSPYEFEDLYIAPPEGRAFAARCTRPREKPDGLAETCLTDLRIGALDAQLRYAPDLLPQWDALMTGARALIEGMKR